MQYYKQMYRESHLRNVILVVHTEIEFSEADTTFLHTGEDVYILEKEHVSHLNY